MHTETFMATAAQVIPTLGIALGLEVGTLLRTALGRSPRAGFEERRSIAAAYVLGMGVNLATGEVAALSTLLVHYPGWTVWIPLGLTIFSIIYALGGMVTIPFAMIRDAVPPGRPRRVRRPRR